MCLSFFFFFSSRRRHTRFDCDWSSDVCSSDLWALIGSPTSGFVNQIWRALGGDGHLIDINTPWGIAWVMALFEGAVAFVMIGAVMKSMDPALEEASQVVGAGRTRTMLRITLPLVLPGVLGATI